MTENIRVPHEWRRICLEPVRTGSFSPEAKALAPTPAAATPVRATHPALPFSVLSVPSVVKVTR